MPDFQPFLMERMMSRFEQRVDYNLSESGVHPVLLEELLNGDRRLLDELLRTGLNYPHVNGIPQLRRNIAALYDGAGADNVLVTVGAIEANYNSVQTLLAPGDEIVVMLPNYMQIWGISRNSGHVVRTFSLREERQWAPDLGELEEAVSEKTRVIAVCNPSNPTGYVLSEAEMDGIVRAAERVGAWIIADEVYRGAERTTDTETPSFYGRYDRVLAVGSMSKAYGLPGLRIGWVVGPVDTIDEIWARHEYTTISATMLSNKLAALALSQEVRPRLIRRTREYIRNGYRVLEKWAGSHRDLFAVVPPGAAAIAFVKYRPGINSTEFVERLFSEKRVLVVPGDHFGMDRFLRIGFGLPHDYLTAGLNRIRDLAAALR